MDTLLGKLEHTSNLVQDPVLRRHAMRLLAGLDDLPIEVLGVGKMREVFPQLRHRVHAGSVALVANRGEVKDEQGTTVMISLENFNRLFMSLIQRSVELQVERTSPSEILMGLHSIPALSKLNIDFDSITHGHNDEELPAVSL
jgi:hypothetical protein